jgi:hypothetical protein
MRRWTRLKTGLLILFTLTAVGGVAVWLLKSEPAYYVRETADTPRPDDPVLSGMVTTRLGELQDDIADKPDWGATFTTDELNAFLRSGSTGKDPIASPLIAGMNRPRMDVKGDRLILSDRYGSGVFSTVWSLELRMWLVDKEPNVLAIEIAGFYAGSMPLPKRAVMTRMGDAMRKVKADVTWYRHNGNPVGLFKLFANQPGATTQLLTLKAKDGKLSIGGKNLSRPSGQPDAK